MGTEHMNMITNMKYFISLEENSNVTALSRPNQA